MEMTPWFLDAWAVYDGVAFASRSDPGIRRTTDSVHAESTVFLSVPELDAIPVGRISTALRATRGSFQDGLFDDDHEEIQFESLDGIRETVRRGYLASGLGPNGVGMPAVPGPFEPAAPEGAAARRELIEQLPADIVSLLVTPSEPGLPAVREFARRFPTQLRQAVRAVAEVVLLDWETEIRGLAHRSYQSELGLTELYLVLDEAGIWTNQHQRDQFLVQHQCFLGMAVADLARVRLVQSRRRLSNQKVLALAPCPVNAAGWPPLGRLTDPLLLAMSDSSYLASERDLLPVAQLVLAALIACNSVSVDVGPWRGADAVLQNRIDLALAWLDHEQPRPVVPAVVDVLLNDFAIARLNEPPNGTGPPLPTPTPSPSGSSGPDSGSAPERLDVTEQSLGWRHPPSLGMTS
jgi:hypothetical protein